MGTLTTRMGPGRRRPPVGSGALQIAAGSGIVLVVGMALLLLPVSTAAGASTSLSVAFFTAVSALSVTGLTVVDTTTHWSLFGKIVILALIQVGGLGYMLGATVVLWALGRRLGLRDKHLLRLYYGAPTLRETMSFAKGIALFSLAFEAVGAVLLWPLFALEGEPVGRSAWWAVFHSISAFNNAGFTIIGGDFERFAGNSAILAVVSALVLAGSIGFLPLATLARRRSFVHLPLDHKLIFLTTAAILATGAVFYTAIEWSNPETLGSVPPFQRAVDGFFLSSARTAGFDAIPVEKTHDETKIAMVGQMFVGGAAGSTAGGLKVGAFSLLFALMVATIRGREEVTAFGRRIPEPVIRQATTLALSLVALVFGFAILLASTSDHPFLDVLVEAVSAITTTGFSSADTATFGLSGRLVIAIAMLVGRFTPLILVLYMTRPRHQVSYRYPEDSVRLG